MIRQNGGQIPSLILAQDGESKVSAPKPSKLLFNTPSPPLIYLERLHIWDSNPHLTVIGESENQPNFVQFSHDLKRVTETESLLAKEVGLLVPLTPAPGHKIWNPRTDFLA